MRPALLTVLLGAALLVPAAGASTTVNHCGTLHGGFESHIRSTLECPVAKKIVRIWHRKAVTNGQGPGNKTVGDFRCRSKATDAEHVRVKCTHKEFSDQWVKFYAGP